MNIMVRVILGVLLGFAAPILGYLIARHPGMPKVVKAVMLFSAFIVYVCLLTLLVTAP